MFITAYRTSMNCVARWQCREAYSEVWNSFRRFI